MRWVSSRSARALPDAGRVRQAWNPLSLTFMLLITGVGALIHVYSVGYMEHDPNRRKFFAQLNLFVAAMLLLGKSLAPHVHAAAARQARARPATSRPAPAAKPTRAPHAVARIPRARIAMVSNGVGRSLLMSSKSFGP